MLPPKKQNKKSNIQTPFGATGNQFYGGLSVLPSEPKPTTKPKSKKPNPVKKYKKSSSEVDWDKVRAFNDNTAVQLAKVFDPTGISSYPDVYYAAKDLAEGKGSWGELGLNVLGALPMVGKSKVLFKLNKASNATKTIKNTKKVLKTVEKVAEKANKIVNAPINKLKPLATSTKVVPKVIGKGAQKTEAVAKTLGKPLSPKNQVSSTKQITKTDAKNVVVDLLDIGNVAADVKAVVKSVTETAPKQEVQPVKPVTKEKVKPKVVYYNTNPKHGEVETPGKEEGVRYAPITNSIQLEKWKQQKLAYGTGEEGIGDPPNRLTFENELLSRVITERNKDKNFVQRALTPSDYPMIINEDGSETTHLMQYSTDDNGNAYVSPTVIQNELGLLSKLTPREAMKYGRQSGEEIKIPDVQLAEYYTENGLIKHSYGTNSQGIMKRKINPKKYANGTDAKGMDPNHYIISPAEALNDYNIMLAKAEAEANSNPWLPIVAMAGQAMQTGIGIAGQASGAKAATGVNDPNSPNYKPKGTAAMGMNNVQQDVEVEGGEMYETPQGQVGEFQGPAHEQGGIPLEVGQDVEEGTKVYSDRLKVGNKTLAERKATRERQVANLEKIASDNLADEAVKNAAKRKMMVIEKEEAADLDFQEKVNNMQKMADTMVKAFGTGVAGIQKMVNGGIVGEPEYDEFGNPIVKPAAGPVIDLKSMMVSPGVSDLGTPKPAKFELTGNPLTDFASNPREYMKATITSDTYFKDTNNVKTFQDWMDTNNPNWLSTGKSLDKGTGYGNYGPNTQKAAENNFEAFKTSLLPAETPASAPTPTDYGAGDFLATFNTEDTPDANASTIVAKTGETAKTDAEGKEPSKLMKALEGNMPAVGDLTKLFGNYLGMTAGIKTAAEQRSTDVTHRNVFENAGKESQKLLDNAKKGIEISKAQGIVKASNVSRGGKRGARGSARGVNQMRAMDWLYDTALEGQIAEISANAANQISQIDIQKSGVAMNADQLKGQGEHQAAMANEAAKDAYYTALALGRKDFATGMQQTGKDLNDMKQNKVVQNLLSQYGQWFKVNADGTVANKNAVATKDTKADKEEEIELTDKAGKKFKITQSQFDKLMNPTV